MTSIADSVVARVRLVWPVAAVHRSVIGFRDYVDRLRGPRVLAVYCGFCHTPVKPRHIRYPAVICRDCDAAGALRTRYPIPHRGAPERGGPR
jgi:hypothetical protein